MTSVRWSRVAGDPTLRAVVAGHPPHPTWGTDEVILSAERAHIGPVLDTALEHLGDALPADARRALALRRLAARHVRSTYLDTFGRVVGELRERKIRFVVLKGLANETRWYQPLERRMSDIDLAVHPDDLAGVPDLVAALAPGDPSTGRAAEALVSGGVDAVDIDCGACYVDIHARVFKALVPARQELDTWQHVDQLALDDGTTIPVLDDELTLIHATLHTLIDRFCFLSGPIDIARMLRDSTLDWDAIETFLEAEGWTEAIAFGLWRVAEIADLPDESIGLVRPGRRRLHETLWPSELIGAGREAWHDSVARSKLLPLAYRGRWADTARGYTRTVFPSDAYLRYRFDDLASTRAGRIAQWHQYWLTTNLSRSDPATD